MKNPREQDRRAHPRVPRERTAGAGALLLLAFACVGALGCDSRTRDTEPRGVATGAAAPGAAEARPDLVVLLLDTLRPDHLPVYGYERETAPFLSSLAREGVRFRNAFSTSSWTAPATASVFTGLYPPRHGVLEGMVAQKASTDTERESLEEIELRAMPASFPTLPERLREAGYESFGVAANINVGAALGFSRGFDRFAYLVDEPANVLVDQLLDWRSEIESSEPFFVYAHFNDAHEPYHERSPWIEEFRASLSPHAGERADVKARYDSEIAFLDAELRRLVERFEWRSRERGRDLVIVVLSDHGEEFWEHGKLGHGYRLFDVLNRVLFVVHAPELFTPREALVNVSLVDVLPTLEELAGVAPRAPAQNEAPGAAVPPSDGRSLLPLMRGAGTGSPADVESLAEWRGRPVFAHRFKSARWWRKARVPLWAVIEPRWKLIAQGESSLLFDLERDPQERQDHSTLEGGRVVAMRETLDAFRILARPIGNEGDAVDIELDEQMRRRLEALGYVDDPEQEKE